MVQARSFAELLEQALLRYQNRAVETAQVIEELTGAGDARTVLEQAEVLSEGWAGSGGSA